MYLIGYDIGSSSIKAALIDARSGQTVHVVQQPEQEMDIMAHQSGWAEQDPETWWHHLCVATRQLLLATEAPPTDIQSIGIAYQMHGLVLVDEQHNVLRSSIIWCDSRAVEIGDHAFTTLGERKCLSRILNSPGNFTASKLRWVRENEPEVYRRIHKVLLPGDYIAMRLSGRINTTISGLSEGMFWDFQAHGLADFLLDHYGIETSLLPDLVPTFGLQGKVQATAAAATGLAAGTPVTYRAGDQPNNALSLGVFQPGEVAATGGTSGVIYGISDRMECDPHSRINGFAHVNHNRELPRIGLLLCINGAGSQYAWLKKQLAEAGTTYPKMEHAISGIPVGSHGLRILPFGNGAERMLGNANPGAHFASVQFNRHTREHFYRAGLEGIAFSFVYGAKILQDLGLDIQVLKVGNDNLFQSEAFSTTIATLLGCRIELIRTTGAAGAAKASGIGIGHFPNLETAINTHEITHVYLPKLQAEPYQAAYNDWLKYLNKLL